MTTVRDVIGYAFKHGRINDTPDADEADDGLVALQSFYDGLITGGMFATLRDVYTTEDYEAEEGDRVIAPAGVTVTFPTTYEDLDRGGERAPRDLSVIETIVNGERTVKVWDRTGWVDMLGLTLGSDAPFANRGAYALGAALACSGAFMAMFGDTDISARSERLARGFLGLLSSKVGTTRDEIPGVYF